MVFQFGEMNMQKEPEDLERDKRDEREDFQALSGVTANCIYAGTQTDDDADLCNGDSAE